MEVEEKVCTVMLIKAGAKGNRRKKGHIQIIGGCLKMLFRIKK